MPVHSKIHSQSGFMSVEAVATALFYLIMVAIITLIAASIMNTGKMANSVSTLSMLRVNLQYVGTSVGSYEEVAKLNLPTLVPGMLQDASTPASGTAILPTKHEISVDHAAATDVDESGTAIGATAVNSYFQINIDGANFEECRRLAYYGNGAGYGIMLGDTGSTSPTAVKGGSITGSILENIESKCADTTGKRRVRLISR